MKTIKQIITAILIITAVSIFTRCKKNEIIQTDKPLLDVVIDKTWEDIDNTDADNFKFCNNGRFILKKECPIPDTTIENPEFGMFWNIKNDTIIFTQHTGTGGHIIDTFQYWYVDKYSEIAITGSYWMSYQNKVGEFTCQICE